jgi:hypothetical protein
MDQITAFQTGNVEYMDRTMYLASLANAICWTTYAGISSDHFILVRKLLLETLHFSLTLLIDKQSSSSQLAHTP